MGPGGLEKLQRHKVSARELDVESEFNIFNIFNIFEVQISLLFSKKSNPCGTSRQTPMWKRILYRSSPCQVFVTFGQKYLFLHMKFHFFMATLFPPFVHLRPVQEGFCVCVCSPAPRPPKLLENQCYWKMIDHDDKKGWRLGMFIVGIFYSTYRISPQATLLGRYRYRGPVTYTSFRESKEFYTSAGYSV